MFIRQFSIFERRGIDGKRYRFDILTSRRKEKEPVHMIDSYELNSFIILNSHGNVKLITHSYALALK